MARVLYRSLWDSTNNLLLLWNNLFLPTFFFCILSTFWPFRESSNFPLIAQFIWHECCTKVAWSREYRNGFDLLLKKKQQMKPTGPVLLDGIPGRSWSNFGKLPEPCWEEQEPEIPAHKWQQFSADSTVWTGGFGQAGSLAKLKLPNLQTPMQECVSERIWVRNTAVEVDSPDQCKTF